MNIESENATRYIFFKFDDESFWIELDDENYAVRQVIQDKSGKYQISCFEDCLAEGRIEEADLAVNVTNISREQFQDIWSSILKPYYTEWQQLKKKYPVGEKIRGKIMFFYPQGAIIQGEDFKAICKGEHNFAIHSEMCFAVVSYDDENMWIEVEEQTSP